MNLNRHLRMKREHARVAAQIHERERKIKQPKLEDKIIDVADLKTQEETLRAEIEAGEELLETFAHSLECTVERSVLELRREGYKLWEIADELAYSVVRVKQISAGLNKALLK
ncbi:MAG: hypothetical protein FWF59_01430 [Turicibacter sp.]|nr:hypothetical protein [Turicibacter sp.]